MFKALTNFEISYEEITLAVIKKSYRKLKENIRMTKSQRDNTE